MVYLTINALDIPLQEVPDVADNSSVRQAEARLLAAGFRLTNNDSIPGEKDWVYAVKYRGNSHWLSVMGKKHQPILCKSIRWTCHKYREKCWKKKTGFDTDYERRRYRH